MGGHRHLAPHLVAVGVAWDDGPDAGGWIAGRHGWFGPSVGRAVAPGYDGYAVVPIAPEDDPHAHRGGVATIEAMLDVLDRFTGDQPVHFGIWDGWPFWYDTGSDPRAGIAIGALWSEEDDRPAREELVRGRAAARELAAANRVECPTSTRSISPTAARTCGLARCARRRRFATSRTARRR